MCCGRVKSCRVVFLVHSRRPSHQEACKCFFCALTCQQFFPDLLFSTCMQWQCTVFLLMQFAKHRTKRLHFLHPMEVCVASTSAPSSVLFVWTSFAFAKSLRALENASRIDLPKRIWLQLGSRVFVSEVAWSCLLWLHMLLLFQITVNGKFSRNDKWTIYKIEKGSHWM